MAFLGMLKKLSVQEVLSEVATVDGLRDMQGLAARFLAAEAQRSPE